MKDKKDFISFLENSHQFITRADRRVAQKRIIKGQENAQQQQISQVAWDEVVEEKPDVTVIENEGRIEAIKFRCRCGCGTMVKIEYETPTPLN